MGGVGTKFGDKMRTNWELIKIRFNKLDGGTLQGTYILVTVLFNNKQFKTHVWVHGYQLKITIYFLHMFIWFPFSKSNSCASFTLGVYNYFSPLRRFLDISQYTCYLDKYAEKGHAAGVTLSRKFSY